MQSLDNALIIFVRNPVLGKVKTRLAATVGNEKALAIYGQLLQHTHNITQPLPCKKFVFYADYINENDLWKKEYYEKELQSGDELGSRMHNAFSEIFMKGFKNICIIGSDCIELNETIISKAFNDLQNHDTIIGPSLDGGYYLLGMNKRVKGIFENKNWSTNEVLNATLKNIEYEKCSCKLLPELSDVDTADDWIKYELTLLNQTTNIKK